MPIRSMSDTEYLDMLATIERQWGASHPQSRIAANLKTYCDRKKPFESTGSFRWEDYSTFWPPRILQSLKDGNLICFFGAGLSIPSGLPTWSGLLEVFFGKNSTFSDDKDLQNDPLTLAELAAHQIGAENLQDSLRNSVNKVRGFSISHCIVASLRLPIYITTNYDSLLEDAWQAVNGGLAPLHVITNSAALRNFVDPATNQLRKGRNESFLIKLHGCASREKEHLILTRSDYRRHYRDNDEFFNEVRRVLVEFHTLFVGFSHSDPEISRLIEDAIYRYEIQINYNVSQGSLKPDATNFGIYSLQFGMGTHTPEIFAARGMVALRPSVADADVDDPRTSALSRSLSELIWAALRYSGEDNLDLELKEIRRALSESFRYSINMMKYFENDATKDLESPPLRMNAGSWLQKLVESAGSLGVQGVYLADAKGGLIDYALPSGLTGRIIDRNTNYGNRPYFRQANTFQKPFISDSFPSIYNGHSTFMVCLPIIDSTTLQFKGLLFAACQIGTWSAPLDLARKLWARRYSLLLVDSNGVCLIPPRGEIEPSDANRNGEDLAANKGYPYEDLLGISRRDKIVTRVMENVIPLGQDDDVMPLGADFAHYSVMTEVPTSRWKLAISSPIKSSSA